MRLSIVILFLLMFRFLSNGETMIPRISPLPINIKTEKISLAGKWIFNAAPTDMFWKKSAAGNEWKSIEVPGEWVMQGFKVENGKAAAYSRSFQIPETWKNKKVKLRCNAIYSESSIYINGKKASYHIGGFTTFETDITDLIKFNTDNRIDIAVTSETLADSLASGSKYAVHQLGGITRDLFLFALPEENISMFHVSTSLDSTYSVATLKAEVSLANETKAISQNSLELQFELTNANGEKIDLEQNCFKIENMDAGSIINKEYLFRVKNPIKWNSEHPYLYSLTVYLKKNDEILHETSRKVGIRQIEVIGNQVLVNGMPIKLHGVCRHEVMPLRGRSVNDSIWHKDVEIFKHGNVNYIRTSHYPPDEALLEACDELGMFVEIEAPFCWAHETKIPNENHHALLVNQHLEMVNLNRSHPSVLMWSMGNESNLFEEYFKDAAEAVKKIDPTRPRIFSQWGPDADNGALELTNHHYPGPKGPEMYRNSKRPIIFDEFCHLNAYNRFELSADPGIRNIWGELLDRMWTNMYYSKGVLGGAIWAGIDDTFFLPDGRVVGYGTWGPIDGWRREKPEYWGMKKAFSPVKIKLIENVNQQGVLKFDIENRYNFTNLAECEIEWKAGKTHGTITSTLDAGEKARLNLQLPPSALNEDSLIVSIKGPEGFIVDEYAFIIRPIRIEIKRKEKTSQLKHVESSDYITIYSLSGNYNISKYDGILEKYNPVLMILPLNSEGRGIQMTGEKQDFEPYNPICTNWIAKSIEKIEIDNGINIKVKGKYDEAEGEFTYSFLENGEVNIYYNFKVLKDISPRQIGIVMTLDNGFNHLKWKRKGYWSVYPNNHIGSLNGEACAFNKTLPISGIAGPSKMPTMDWCYDQTKGGSNMFRSTKENIYLATISNDNLKSSFTILSDGTQSLRCWKEKDLTKVLISDYNNAGKEGFLVSHAEYAYRPLHYGDEIKGRCRFIQLSSK